MTKQNKLKADVEKTNRMIGEAENLKPEDPNKPKPNHTADKEMSKLQLGLSKGPLGSTGQQPRSKA